jgi:tryptophanyl-tRNA synthetase
MDKKDFSLRDRNPEQIIDGILADYYAIHHDKDRFRRELVESARGKVVGFMEAKRRVVEGLDYRLERLQESLAVLKKEGNSQDLVVDMESRIDEVETFRAHLKGMVTAVDDVKASSKSN